ncbi:zinc-binding protein A33-like [Osmerus mordax]|uniref:zinc-binding protein A33-like n=1 Tax=Osmerus mordax TaxID=8014 RepID=UPI00350E981A
MSSLTFDPSLLSKEQFQCSICLQVFTDPVTTPCGHTFCKACIGQKWEATEACQCPKCNKRFYGRPEVSTNSVLEEISVQIKKRKLQVPECFAEAWEVACDVCVGRKLRALKSCLVCLTSYCETHLEPHERVAGLKIHKLIDPVENLEDRMCMKHQRLLEMFCKTDQRCVCVLCVEAEHKSHDTVPVEELGGKVKAELGSTKMKIQQKIQTRLEKVEEIKKAVEHSKVNSEKEVEDSGKVITALLETLKKRQAKLRRVIQERQKAEDEWAKYLIKTLEEEIAELRKESTELEQLSLTEDPLLLLQSRPPLGVSLSTKKWSRVKVHTDLCVGTVRRAWAQIEETIKMEVKSFTDTELKRMQRFKEDVKMDVNTASCRLKLSVGGKKIKYAKVAQVLPEQPERFSFYSAVLGEKGFNSGRHYWEVAVGAYGRWEVGVATEKVNRKDAVAKNSKNGFFALSKSGFWEFEALSSPSTTLHLTPKPRQVGVYVDYEKGQVSFYDVTMTSHIFSFFGQSFSGKLYPYFYLYSMARKSESLVLS